MISTVVGSYPVIFNKNSLSFKNKLSNIFSNDSYKSAIKYAVESQLNAGIDIISDGQVRGDMVDLFLSKIPGFIKQENTYIIKSKIQRPNSSIVANDLKIAIKFLKNYFKEFNNEYGYDLSKKGVKGLITGPSTLIQSSKLTNIYKNKDLAILDLARVLSFEAKSLEKAGAKLIQIDEPFLSTGLLDMNIAKQAIAIISKDLKIPISIHCCGDIKNIFSDLADFDVDIIDCEFAGHPSNMETLEKYSHKLINKKIGLGVVDTKKSIVDSVDEIAKIISRGIDIMGTDNLFIDPDCGMRLLDEKIAFNKLKNMVEAMNSFIS
ncbi:MAG: methionine synthase [Methanobrevibacter sp.]|jgi:5-methyltetrahydropteroyltriglutamate--homocysteine methyltransferase|nr:methionine synthase [Candidatus Methanoflexus mossambicus]